MSPSIVMSWKGNKGMCRLKVRVIIKVREEDAMD